VGSPQRTPCAGTLRNRPRRRTAGMVPDHPTPPAALSADAERRTGSAWSRPSWLLLARDWPGCCSVADGQSLLARRCERTGTALFVAERGAARELPRPRAGRPPLAAGPERGVRQRRVRARCAAVAASLFNTVGTLRARPAALAAGGRTGTRSSPGPAQEDDALERCSTSRRASRRSVSVVRAATSSSLRASQGGLGRSGMPSPRSQANARAARLAWA
jgi:hypothetical protein